MEKLEKLVKRIRLNYVISACIFCLILILGLWFIAHKTFTITAWSYGIIVLLFLSFLIGLLAVISVVAAYREMSRLNAEELSEKMQDLKKENETLRKKVNEMKKENEALRKKVNENEDGISASRQPENM